MSFRKNYNPTIRAKLRHANKEDLKVTAFHESGHVVADWVCLDLLWFEQVTIRPDDVYLGYLDTDDNRAGLVNVFPSYKRAAEIQLMRCLICDLAGPCAENMISTKDSAWFRKGMAEERHWEISDYFRAADLVKSLFQNPALEKQITEKAGRWTEELLKRPEIWKIVENLVVALLKKRTLNKDQVCGVIAMTWKDMSVVPYFVMGNKWLRRLHISDEILRAA
jgi:hypothetical protein